VGLRDHYALGSFLVIVALGWRKQGRMGQPCWTQPFGTDEKCSVLLKWAASVGTPLMFFPSLRGYRKAYQILDSYIAKGSEEKSPIQFFSSFRHD